MKRRYKLIIIICIGIILTIIINSLKVTSKTSIVALGDGFSEGMTPYNVAGMSYNDYLKELYLKDNNLDDYNHEFTEEHLTTHMLNEIISNNKKGKLTGLPIKQVLAKADLITISIGLNEFAEKSFLEKINKDYKILVDQGKMKTFAYSKLVDELDGLSLKLSRLQDDLDYQLRSITSMKDDETRAREQLNTIEDLLKKSKYRLKDYKIPVIPSSYYIELTEAQDAIREIIKELDRKPIVIKILNIRVDTARDLVFKIYNKTNDMIKIASMSEKIIETYKEL